VTAKDLDIIFGLFKLAIDNSDTSSRLGHFWNLWKVFLQDLPQLHLILSRDTVISRPEEDSQSACNSLFQNFFFQTLSD
jgi:hypothetical protein